MGMDMSVFDATVASVDVGRRSGLVGASDAGVVAALLALARKIDAQDEYFRELVEQADERGSRAPSVDNVSLPTYLKYCNDLGLTPAGRATIESKRPAKSERPTVPDSGAAGSVTELRALRKGVAR